MRHFNTRQLAQATGDTQQQIQKHCEDGTLMAYRNKGTGHWRIPEASVRAYVSGRSDAGEVLQRLGVTFLEEVA